MIFDNIVKRSTFMIPQEIRDIIINPDYGFKYHIGFTEKI